MPLSRLARFSRLRFFPSSNSRESHQGETTGIAFDSIGPAGGTGSVLIGVKESRLKRAGIEKEHRSPGSDQGWAGDRPVTELCWTGGTPVNFSTGGRNCPMKRTLPGFGQTGSPDVSSAARCVRQMMSGFLRQHLADIPDDQSFGCRRPDPFFTFWGGSGFPGIRPVVDCHVGQGASFLHRVGNRSVWAGWTLVKKWIGYPLIRVQVTKQDFGLHGF